MALKDLLVHVDGSNSSAARLAAAIRLAETHDAHLIGIFVKGAPNLPSIASPEMTQEFMKIQEAYTAETAALAEAQFEAHAKASAAATEWRVVSGDPVEQLALHGRYVDLVVAGQQDPQAADLPVLQDVPDRLILSVGRPVLVVPHVGEYPAMGGNVMVAWDASRLATRAVNDALPLLERAGKVNILAANPGTGATGHGDVPSADIALHLARHGVNAEAHTITAEDMDIGNLLLSRAADFGADMIVMGAYGHRRLRELVLGGATRHMLKHMTVPVFMAH